MGVVVRGVGVSRPGTWPLTHGARRLADTAAKRCLRQAGCTADDVDMLINTGVYRERGLGEPALAALIQEDVEASTRGIETDRHGTFSFDVDNGACGVLTGVELLGGFLASGAIDLGMVVASDSGPGPVHARDLPYAEAGGALLLASDDAVEGFSAVSLTTYPEYAELLEGYWRWSAHRLPAPGRFTGRNRLVVAERAGFRDRAVDCAAESAGKFLADAGLVAGDVDLLIATPEPGFGDPLADRLGVPHAHVLHVGEGVGRCHSAQPIVAIDVARRTGRWDRARTILFVSAGSGITVATALYRH